jgi:hypothetical protein
MEVQMKSHPLVEQLRFARSEFQRALIGLNDEDARRRLLPMNAISWNIGHLAWQEQRYYLFHAQGWLLLPEVNELYAYGAPACTPPLADVQGAWQAITSAADPWLDMLTTARLQEKAVRDGKPSRYLWGSLLLRTIDHYWYHTGENSAIRQMLGHKKLPDFVGDIDREAPYRPE